MRGALKMLAATTLFGIGHSLLAARSAKRAAGRVLAHRTLLMAPASTQLRASSSAMAVPQMTSRLAAMGLASTAYLMLGSMLEETRLRSAYERYRTSAPFYAPRPPYRGAVPNLSR